jgi:hypothetical protein
VAVDALNNIAYVMVANGGRDNGAFQVIDLGSQSTLAVIVANDNTSEDISVDPRRRLMLSPNENSNYQLINTSTNAVYDNKFSGSFEFDSAGEDCLTGIALSTDEFTGNMILADLTQATFTPGPTCSTPTTCTPNGTWTAPTLVQDFPEFRNLGAGTSAVVVAPGTHFAVVGGEFGGSLVGAMQLQSTSGAGTSPNVPDYVVMNIPNAPDGSMWQMGDDPHTTTAYTSPNTSRAFAVVSNGDGVAPTWLAVIDIEAMLAAPRGGAHAVAADFDLVGHGVVRFVPTN